jgi:hypothetical protein
VVNDLLVTPRRARATPKPTAEVSTATIEATPESGSIDEATSPRRNLPKGSGFQGPVSLQAVSEEERSEGKAQSKALERQVSQQELKPPPSRKRERGLMVSEASTTVGKERKAMPKEKGKGRREKEADVMEIDQSEQSELRNGEESEMEIDTQSVVSDGKPRAKALNAGGSKKGGSKKAASGPPPKHGIVPPLALGSVAGTHPKQQRTAVARKVEGVASTVKDPTQTSMRNSPLPTLLEGVPAELQNDAERRYRTSEGDGLAVEGLSLRPENASAATTARESVADGSNAYALDAQLQSVASSNLGGALEGVLEGALERAPSRSKADRRAGTSLASQKGGARADGDSESRPATRHGRAERERAKREREEALRGTPLRPEPVPTPLLPAVACRVEDHEDSGMEGVEAPP